MPLLIMIAKAGAFREIDSFLSRTAELAAELGLATFVYDRIGLDESIGPRPSQWIENSRYCVPSLNMWVEALCGHSSGLTIAMRAAVVGLPITGLDLGEVPEIGSAQRIQTWATDFDDLLDVDFHLPEICLFEDQLAVRSWIPISPVFRGTAQWNGPVLCQSTSV